jgi:hypothetical protein
MSGEKYADKAETMQLIKQAIYDLQIGPTEISCSTRRPATYSVKFENRKGEAEEVVVEVPSMYPSIHHALKLAYNA